MDGSRSRARPPTVFAAPSTSSKYIQPRRPRQIGKLDLHRRAKDRAQRRLPAATAAKGIEHRGQRCGALVVERRGGVASAPSRPDARSSSSRMQKCSACPRPCSGQSLSRRLRSGTLPPLSGGEPQEPSQQPCTGPPVMRKRRATSGAWMAAAGVTDVLTLCKLAFFDSAGSALVNRSDLAILHASDRGFASGSPASAGTCPACGGHLFARLATPLRFFRAFYSRSNA